MSELIALLERVAVAAERIAASLSRMEPDEEQPDPVDEGEAVCLHPTNSRIGFGVTEGVEDWECRICHFRSTNP